MAIPNELHKGEGFSARLLDLTEADGTMKGDADATPFFKNDTTGSTAEQLKAAPPGRWSPEEARLLCYRSAVYIPVLVQGKIARRDHRHQRGGERRCRSP